MSTDAKSPNVRELYVQAVRIEEDAARQVFLDEACRGEIELRQRVEKLLVARCSDRDNLLQRATADSMSGRTSLSWDGAELGVARRTHPEAMGDDRTRDDTIRGRIDVSTHPMIGHYRLLEELGHGGMGTVYMAAQSKPVKRQVALKVIKPGMDSKEVIARFEAERQALAMMDHPHIARVLDGGTTDEGRPYFVMELVRGVPITEFCKRKSLPLRQRLELFVDICHAVQHAHQKGIIHRDLKPGNIMVTLHDGKPVVKVIDFGVAKALHQELTERTLFTHFSQMVGTPLYMAPEQAEMSGLGVDTRSDIYSLGVVLYELLTGTTPFDRDTMSKLGIDGIRKLIQEHEPPRPSARISTLKAANHSTVEDERQLDTEYIGKQLNHELDWIVMKALEKDRERRYETANAFAADIQRYLNDEPVEAYPPSVTYRLKKHAVKNKALLTTGLLVLAVLSASTAVSAVFAYQATHAKNKAVEAQGLADRRLTQSRVDFERALKSIDMIVAEVSRPDFAQLPGSDKVRARIVRQSMLFYEQIVKEHDQDPYARAQRANAHVNLAVHYGEVPLPKKQLHEINESIEILQTLIDEYPSNDDYKEALAFSLYKRSWVELRTDKEQQFDAEHALKILRQSRNGDYPKNLEIFVALIRKVMLYHPYSSREALAMAKEALQVPYYGKSRAYVIEWLARKAKHEGDLQQAILHCDTTLELLRGLLSQPTDDLSMRRHLTATLRFSGELHAAQGDFELAEERFREAYEYAFQLNRMYYYSKMSGATLVTRAIDLVTFLYGRGRLDDGDKCIKELLTRDNKLDDAQLQSLYRRHSLLLQKSGDAVGRLASAVDEFPGIMIYRRRLCDVYRELADLEAALSEANRMVEVAEDGQRFDALFARAIVHVERGDDVSAINDYDQILTVEHPQWDGIQRRGACYFRIGQYDKALADLREAMNRLPSALLKLTEIPPHQVARCPSEEYRNGYLKLVDEVAEKNDRSPSSLIMRAMITSTFGETTQPFEDLRVVASDDEAPYYLLYQAGLLSIRIAKPVQYREICETMMARFATSYNPLQTHFTAWTCALAPNALDDYEPALKLARLSVESAPNKQQYIGGLGAILMRAGKYDEAKKQLDEALDSAETDKASPSYTRYFLAMTEHHLGDTKNAETHLRKAIEIAESELSEFPTWNRRLTLELLRSEAESQVTPPQNGPKVKSNE